MADIQLEVVRFALALHLSVDLERIETEDRAARAPCPGRHPSGIQPIPAAVVRWGRAATG